jgi:hypothetical protein
MRTCLFGLAVAALGLAGVARADEEKVPLDKLPKSVTEAIKHRFTKSELVGGAKATENGKTTYEVSLKDGAHKIDVSVSADGKITGMEKEVAMGDLPKAVSSALKAKYPKATYRRFEEVINVKDGNEVSGYYEAIVVVGDMKPFEVEVMPDGTIKEPAKK